jgi:DNA-3-methyladenine glycosylase I
MASTKLHRCGWVSDDLLYQKYHDEQWGRPVLDSKELFAKLCLDGQQAGLSWITILKKQENYEAAFHDFEPTKIIQMDKQEIAACLQNPGIVRNKLKVASIIKNAHGYLNIEKRQGFSDFIWQFTDGKTIINEWKDFKEAPTFTAESKAMSKALKKEGFSFVGETICYAFMQAVGIVNDHVTGCHCYEETCQLARR